MINILVLCRGNITRSPFIAGYLNHLYRQSEFYHKVELEIDSSGLEGKTVRPPHPRVIDRGLELGFDIGSYRSKHSDVEMMEKADLIFVVDEKQYERFKKVYTHLLKKTYHLHEFGRDEDNESIDFEDPSKLNREKDFVQFFKFAESEIKRVWEYIEQMIREAGSAGITLTPETFHKKENVEEESEIKYRGLSRRLYPMCPFCQSKRIRRVKRKGLLKKKIYPQFNGYPYHCGNCEKDFILYIGPDLKSTRRGAKKMEKWRNFIEKDKSVKVNSKG